MSTLPTIHPLSETPLGRGPAGECLCNWCRHWSPLLRHVESELSPERSKLLSEYTEYVDHRILDGDVDSARLAGDWSGFEALKGLGEDERTAIAQLAEEGDMEPGFVLKASIRLYQLWRGRINRGERAVWYDKDGRELDRPVGCPVLD